MSNVMHKVKDAMSSHHDKDAAYRKDPDNFNDTGDDYGSSNPPMEQGGQNQYNPSGMNPFREESQKTGRPTRTTGMGNTDTGADPDTYGSTTMGGDNSANVGPHSSRWANKMDPRVDSDLDNRGQFAGNTGPQSTGGSTQESMPSNISSTRGSDHHTTSEESYSTSTQEHKSHSSTSHNDPCQMDPSGQAGLDNRPQQQGFGGGSAPGGSSYNDPNQGVRGTSGAPNPDPLNKLDPRVRGSQQNTAGNQRGGY